LLCSQRKLSYFFPERGNPERKGGNLLRSCGRKKKERSPEQRNTRNRTAQKRKDSAALLATGKGYNIEEGAGLRSHRGSSSGGHEGSFIAVEGGRVKESSGWGGNVNPQKLCKSSLEGGAIKKKAKSEDCPRLGKPQGGKGPSKGKKKGKDPKTKRLHQPTTRRDAPKKKNVTM